MNMKIEKIVKEYENVVVKFYMDNGTEFQHTFKFPPEIRENFMSDGCFIHEVDDYRHEISDMIFRKCILHIPGGSSFLLENVTHFKILHTKGNFKKEFLKIRRRNIFGYVGRNVTYIDIEALEETKE